MTNWIQTRIDDFEHFCLEHEVGDVRWSVWTNRTGKQLKQRFVNDYSEALLSAGINEIALMTDSQLDDDSRTPTYSFSKYNNDVDLFHDVCYAIQSQGFSTIPVSWIDIHKNEIDKFFNGFDKLPSFGRIVADANCKRAEIDWEGANDPGDDMVRYFSNLLKEDKEKYGYVMDVDTHAARVSPREPLHLYGEASRIFVQMYSSYDASDPDRWWGAKHGPLRRQRYGDERVRDFAKANSQFQLDFGVGLACYSQEYPREAGSGAPRSGEESMIAAITEAIMLGYRDVRFWKLKNFVENQYASIAVKTVNAIISSSRGRGKAKPKT